MLGIIKEWQGELLVAKEYYERALNTSHEIGDALNEHQFHICRIAIFMGEYIDAERRAQKSLRFFEGNGHKVMMARIHHCLVVIYTKLGLYKEAEDHQARVVQYNSIREAYVDSLITLGIIYKGQEHYEKALSVLKDALEVANELEVDYLQAEVYRSIAHVYYLLDHSIKSIEAYKISLSFYQDLELEHEKIQVIAGLADALQQSGDLATATEYVADILLYLEKNPEKIYILKEPFELYLHCYHVLDSSQNQHSLSILDTAYALLQAYANRIHDERRRAIFLGDVAANRTIIELWRGHNEC